MGKNKPPGNLECIGFVTCIFLGLGLVIGAITLVSTVVDNANQIETLNQRMRYVVSGCPGK